MAVLYRKYRPQTFEKVVGQKAIVRTLQNQVKSGQVAHAYLFCGSRGIGKTSVARILAKAVNCLRQVESGKLKVESKANPHPGPLPKGEGELTGDPCGECEVCKAIELGNFLDLVEIDAASNTGVDNIRDLIEHVKFSPSLGKYKVFIIDEVHMLSKGAFNALLKTLEEPPAHAIFILATTEIGKVPPTIISRTQRFDFKRFTAAEITELVESVLKQENLKLHSDVIKLIVESSEGGGRDALSLLDKVTTLGENPSIEDCLLLLGITDFKTSHKLLGLIARGEQMAIPAFFDGLLETGIDFAVFNRDFLEYLRKMLICRVANVVDEIAKDHEAEIREQAQIFSAQELIFIVRLFLKSYKDLPFSPRADIPLLLASLEAAQKQATGNTQKAIGNRQQGSLSTVDQPVISTSSVASTFAKANVDKKATSSPSQEKRDTSSEAVKQPTVSVSNQAEKFVSDEKLVPSANQNYEADITLAEVQIWWPAFLEAMKKRNSPLANVLRTGTIESISGSSINLGVKFAFHRENIENQKNQAIIREILKEICGKSIAVRAVISSDLNLEAPKVGPSLAEALQVFGGELIE